MKILLMMNRWLGMSWYEQLESALRYAPPAMLGRPIVL